jgi:16S rRNA C1402 (ribose-2'-O) methylase RsmI
MKDRDEVVELLSGERLRGEVVVVVAGQAAGQKVQECGLNSKLLQSGKHDPQTRI